MTNTMLVCPLNATAASVSHVGNTQWHVLSVAAVRASVWDEPQGTGARADGANRADRPFFPKCNAFVHGRNGTRRVRVAVEVREAL